MIRARMIVLATLALAGCSAQVGQFKEGLYAVGGVGSGTARNDSFDQTKGLATVTRQQHSPPPSAWETVLPDESADLIRLLDGRRVLVGVTVIDGDLGVPDHGPVQLYDAVSGSLLWQAPRPSFRSGRYALVSTEPSIVLLGSDPNRAHVLALDAASGVRRWEHALTGPFRAALSLSGDRLVVVSAERSRRTLQAVALDTGAVAWSVQLDAAWFDELRAPELQLAEDAVIVAGRKIVKVGLRDGRVLWSVEHPLQGAADASLLLDARGIFVWNGHAGALLGAADGRTLWNVAHSEGVTKLVTIQEGRLIRVATRPRPANMPLRSFVENDLVQALDAGTGRALWAQEAGGVVVSSVVFGADTLFYTTDDQVVGMELATGRRRLRGALPAGFVTGGTKARYMPSVEPGALPDQLRLRGQVLLVARDARGIAAYPMSGGKPTWVQLAPPFMFSAVSNQETLRMAVAGLAAPNAPAPAAVAAQPAPGPSAGLKMAQSNYDAARGRYERVQGSASSSQSQRSAARGRYLMASSLLQAQERMDMASAGFNSAAGIAQAGAATIDALAAMKAARDATVAEAAVARARMRLEGAYYHWQNAFRDNWYLQPYGVMERGVMLVNLDTSERSDVVYAVMTQPEQGMGIDFQNSVFDEFGKRLFAAGIGLNPDRYQDYVKWRWRKVRPSMLAYDLSRVKFERPKASPVAGQESAEAPGFKPGDIRGTLIWPAMNNDFYGLRAALAAGANVNERFPPVGVTALHMAAANDNRDMAQLLLEYGADPTITDNNGHDAIWTATQRKNPAIADLLKQAKTRANTPK